MPKFSFSPLPLLLCLALATPVLQAQQSPSSPGIPSAAAPQAGDAQCILAGRLSSEGRWAPQTKGMQLLDTAGKPVSSAAQTVLSSIKSVRVSSPMLLSKCNAGQAMADGDASQGSKSPTPALTAGNAPIEVQAMATLPGRAGGQWVELRVSVPAERVVMLTR
ncbi:hypothetical protein [Variovorax sp. PCZ-1]|uniref:hypothetical protein n=1 Tax=Variovorax sp. PCZ-1 TaxID=2835533 RepID=UPI001BD18367|nr:hypothetical protein [Variovorax sp. PCZ-1]MBS7808905.1 hypothetical protein [Variovorax sp. PCZ-1]